MGTSDNWPWYKLRNAATDREKLLSKFMECKIDTRHTEKQTLQDGMKLFAISGYVP